uniref:Uncharacterized protein n=1 Tax=Schistosoma japonicum TaxID=6182 RepID=C1LE92_SCHJA|nr:hypothetical protein [Schistosoma japonicum]
MASRIFTVSFSLIILWILSMIAVEPITYLQPVKFDNDGKIYMTIANANITMTKNYVLNISDIDCYKWIRFEPQYWGWNDTGYRSVHAFCHSWCAPIPSQRRTEENFIEIF